MKSLALGKQIMLFHEIISLRQAAYAFFHEIISFRQAEYAFP